MQIEFADRWEKFNFDFLFQTLQNVLDLQDLPGDKQTRTTARLIEILQSQRDRIRRIDEWKEKQKRQSEQ